MAQNDLLNYSRVMYSWRRFIVGLVGVTAVVAVIVSFLLPKWYMARTTVLPPQEAGLESSLMSLVQGISLPGIGGLSAASGESQMFLAILDSRTIREKLINEFDLMKVYKAKRMDDALRAFGNVASAGITDRGVVEVIVEDKDPERAANIANTWIEHLDDYNKNARMTAGKKSRLFVERRLDDTRAALVASEDTVAAYQRTHKSVPLSSDLSAAVDAGASLIAQRLSLQVKLSLLSDLYKDRAPLVEQTRAELAALDRQIDLMPPLAMDYARLLRDLKVQEQVYALLIAQYEESKIRENKDTPTLDVLDRAVPPQRKSRPIRWLFVVSLTFAAVILSIGTAFTVEFWRHLKSQGIAGEEST